MNDRELVTTTAEKLINGGQAIATLEDGKKVLIWNALPGEKVKAKVYKSYKNYCEATAVQIISPHPERTEPKDEAYLSTSPWQISTIDYENKIKKEIVTELFRSEGIGVKNFGIKFNRDQEYGYRNKMEYSFFGDDTGLHLALHNRGTHHKIIVNGSSLAMSCIDIAANRVLEQLSRMQIQAGKLKSLVLRSNQQGEVVGALFVKEQKIEFNKRFSLSKDLKGLAIYYSNPNSPVSVPTKELYTFGDITLTDLVLGKNITYDVLSFFQVNLPVFNKALQKIKKYTDAQDYPIYDYYAGVGSIGVAVDATALIEFDSHNIEMAFKNTMGTNIKVLSGNSENNLKYIVPESCIIVDPPRAGLHKDFLNKLVEELPKTIIYLSCNPVTQARDIKSLLLAGYRLEHFELYNFFPHTPHIESLVVLVINNS